MRKKVQMIVLLSITFLIGIIGGGCDKTVENQIENSGPPTVNNGSVLQEKTEKLKFSIDDLSKEIVNDKPGQTEIRYFIASGDSSEENVLHIYAMTEEHDIDEDGLKEIVVYHQGDKKGIGIYYIESGALKYLNVNNELSAIWSDYMGNVGNVEAEYVNCIGVGFVETDGKERYEVYRFKDYALVYVCSLDDALRK